MGMSATGVLYFGFEISKEDLLEAFDKDRAFRNNSRNNSNWKIAEFMQENAESFNASSGSTVKIKFLNYDCDIYDYAVYVKELNVGKILPQYLEDVARNPALFTALDDFCKQFNLGKKDFNWNLAFRYWE